MLHFLRKLRLSNIKGSKYFKYAIGEIVLVVIGILIAVQINNWNEARKDRLQEQVILNALLKEFSSTREAFEESINTNDRIARAMNTFYSQTGNKWDGSLSRQGTDSLMIYLTGGVTADVSTSYLDELLNTGRILIIQNERLQFLLTGWNTELVDHQMETETRINETVASIISPFMFEHYSMYLDRVKPYVDTPSGFEFDYTEIFQNRTFENFLLRRIYTSNRANNEYRTLIGKVDEIIALIEGEIRRDG